VKEAGEGWVFFVFWLDGGFGKFWGRIGDEVESGLKCLIPIRLRDMNLHDSGIYGEIDYRRKLRKHSVHSIF